MRLHINLLGKIGFHSACKLEIVQQNEQAVMQFRDSQEDGRMLLLHKFSIANISHGMNGEICKLYDTTQDLNQILLLSNFPGKIDNYLPMF